DPSRKQTAPGQNVCPTMFSSHPSSASFGLSHTTSTSALCCARRSISGHSPTTDVLATCDPSALAHAVAVTVEGLSDEQITTPTCPPIPRNHPAMPVSMAEPSQ